MSTYNYLKQYNTQMLNIGTGKNISSFKTPELSFSSNTFSPNASTLKPFSLNAPSLEELGKQGVQQFYNSKGASKIASSMLSNSGGLNNIGTLESINEKKNLKKNRYGISNTDNLNKVASIANGISQITSSINSNSSNAQTDSAAYSAGQGIGDAVSKIHPIAAAAVAAGRVVDSLVGDKGWNSINKDYAKRAGISGFGASANNVLASIPGNSIWGFALGRTKKASSSKYFDSGKGASGYSKSFQDYNAAKSLGGTSSLFNRKANKFISEVGQEIEKVSHNMDKAEMAKQNSMYTTYSSQNQNKYSGYTPTAILSVKKGTKFPELGEARKLLHFINSKEKDHELPKFQVGGKMNLIPEGALHARKHDIASTDPELEGQITSKGIPVVSKSEGGIIQHAEIEKEEWTLRKEFTDQLEELYKKYQENPSDELAIEAGKLICYELLKNTDDRSGLIKSIK